MPIIENLLLYQLTYRTACFRFSRGGLGPYERIKLVGDPLYRYVDYRWKNPQVEDDGRKIFRELTADTDNRWTGLAADGMNGRQGLYLSGEHVNPGNPFPELSHYQSAAPNDGTSDKIAYYEYHPSGTGNPAIDPTMRQVEATRLRSLFLFTVKEGMQGLNLKLVENGKRNPLIEEIYYETQREQPDLFAGQDLESLYNHPTDASFCRALGNACLEKTGYSYFETNSVRDVRATNVIMRGSSEVPPGERSPRPLENLKPQGRVTYFVDPEGKVGQSAFTISDLLYNAKIENDLQPEELPSKEIVKDILVDIATHSAKQLDTQFEQFVQRTEGVSEKMVNLYDKIVTLNENMGDGDIQKSMDTIQEVQQKAAELAHDTPSISESEQSAASVANKVAQALDSIAKGIEAAQNLIENNPDEDPSRDNKVEIENDPDPKDLDPKIEIRGKV